MTRTWRYICVTVSLFVYRNYLFQIFLILLFGCLSFEVGSKWVTGLFSSLSFFTSHEEMNFLIRETRLCLLQNSLKKTKQLFFIKIKYDFHFFHRLILSHRRQCYKMTFKKATCLFIKNFHTI